MGERGISKEQDREYVLEMASIVAKVKFRDDGGMTRDARQALQDLRTAVAFYEAHDA